ncbi:MAG: HD-GYP domain-containing protein, partial [Chloroflexi bacterium]|nr:HD-GYP domain-containing protein [Chloroflexota bacterium]
MKRVSVSELKAGDVLGRAIYNEKGATLLQRGVTLNRRYVEAIRQRGFLSVYICDGIADDVEPQEIVSEKVRVAARKHLHDVFTLVRRASEESQDSHPSWATRLNGTVAPLVQQLRRDVESIIYEVLSTDAVSGVISLKSHDNYTFEHSVEVTVAGVLLGKRLGLPFQTLQQLALGCLLHDIGKLVVPQDILNKSGGLSEEEFAVVRQHPQIGYEMVQEIVPSYQVLARHVILQHHERQDGTGYPHGRKGYNSILRHSTHRFMEPWRILLVAEIAAVADVYSALASDRPYRPAMESAEIVSCLQEMAGSHLNSQIVTHFLSVLPVYPIGTQVAITSGELEGWRGVVIETNPSAVDRPVVRILFDPDGQEIAPFEVDTSKNTWQ